MVTGDAVLDMKEEVAETFPLLNKSYVLCHLVYFTGHWHDMGECPSEEDNLIISTI